MQHDGNYSIFVCCFLLCIIQRWFISDLYCFLVEIEEAVDVELIEPNFLSFFTCKLKTENKYYEAV